MIFSFKKTALLFMIPTVIFAAVSIWFIVDSVFLHSATGTINTILLMISVVVLFICSRLSLRLRTKLYNESVRLCDNDINAFIAEQDRIFSRASGKNKAMILMNKSLGLIAWERLDEAEQALREAEALKSVKSSRHLQMIVLSRRISIAMRRRNFDKAREYAERQRQLISEMKLDGTVIEQKYLRAVESNIGKCELLEKIHSSENCEKIAAGLLEDTKQSLEALNENALFYIYLRINLEYTSGLLCYAMGDSSEADRYFRLASEEKAAYPIIQRLKKYLEDKDIRALVENAG